MVTQDMREGAFEDDDIPFQASQLDFLEHKMSPTIFKEKGYRFYFFSKEESRMHVHVTCSDGEAKFW